MSFRNTRWWDPELGYHKQICFRTIPLQIKETAPYKQSSERKLYGVTGFLEISSEIVD